MDANSYVKKRKRLSGLFFETALPNEYLVVVGKKSVKPVLGGRKFKWFKKFLRVPAYVQRLHFSTDNANVDYQGIGIDGYASWRINPEMPEKSIATLDFFDDNDPMARTNNDLKTICIEAVRHVIANMSIDDALKKKDEIAENLKNQLKIVEDKWGIVFDQVGIEKVRIMSSSVFNDLQSQFRNRLRLDSEKTRIDTDRQVAQAENQTREKTQKEKVETDQRLKLVELEKNNQVREYEMAQNQEIAEKQREISQKNFRKEMEFKHEQEQKQHELNMLAENLKIAFQEIELRYLRAAKEVETERNTIQEKELKIKDLARKIEQSFTDQELKRRFISELPGMFESIQIGNYSVLNSGAEGNASPVATILSEIVHTLKNYGIDFCPKEK